MDQIRNDLRILWGSPLPPTHSGVADYATELLPELAQLARVRVLEPPDWTIPGNWSSKLETVPADTPAEDDEIVLVHLGNNPHHRWLLHRLGARERIVVVLHDTVLHHLLVESTAALGDHRGYVNSLEAAHGNQGHALAAARKVGHHGRLDPFLFPARGPFLDGAAAVLVHSRWAEELIQKERPRIAVGRVGLSVADPQPVDRTTVRSGLGLTHNEVVLMHLGFLTQEKGLEEIITGVAAANKAGVAVRLVVVGEGEGMNPLRNAAALVGIDDRLMVTGWVEPELFPSLPVAADLGIAFRTPSAGETSAAALRFFACGVPVAVGGVRQFLEWPEPAAPRLTPGPSAPAELARLLAEIGTVTWGSRGRAARLIYDRSHRPDEAAKAMVTFLKEVALG